jgi:pimeloyl-ACP methyl ester carboxylesterase
VSNITGTSSEWEQSFSPDQGTTWEVNWTMSFTKCPATEKKHPGSGTPRVRPQAHDTVIGVADNPVVLDETFEWNGACVRWARFGDGPPVVACHGTPWSSFVWRSFIDVLKDDRCVFVWDMLGYGQSDKPDSDVSLRTQGELFAALIEHWRIDPPAIIAHDYGGAVALRGHLLHDVPVESFALIDVVALRPWGSPFFRLVADNAAVFTALPSNLHEALLREYISGASATGLWPDVMNALIAPWLGEGQAAFYRQIAQADERFTDEIEPLYGDIDVPTLIVWGTDDVWIPPDRAERLRHLISNSVVEYIERAGHLVQEDQPAALTSAIHRWIHQHPR